MLSRALLVSVATLMMGCGAFGVRPPPAAHRVTEVRYVMGTLLDITLYAPSQEEGRALIDEAFSIAEHLDNALSTYKSDSAVSLFNRSLDTKVHAVDPALYRLVEVSQRLSEQTAGAFTISVRPLVEMWERAAQSGEPPTGAEIKETKRLVGVDAILRGPLSRLGKKLPQVKIETGGIGKGFALDEMVKLLHRRGVSQAFINFGRSSSAALGAPPGEVGWKVQLVLADNTSEGTLMLKDETLSVSRADGNPFVVGGVSYAHIFDPLSGLPVQASRGAAVRSLSATAGEAYVKYLVIRAAPPKEVSQRWAGAKWIVRSEGQVQSSSEFFNGIRTPL